MDSKRKHNGLCTDSGCKVLRQQKTRHWTYSQRECQCVSAPKQSSKLYHSALDPLMCHILMNTQRLSLYTMPEKLTIKSFSCPCLSIIDDATAVPASQPHTHHQEHDKTDGCNARYGRDRAHQNILIMKAISSEQLICWNSWNS